MRRVRDGQVVTGFGITRAEGTGCPFPDPIRVDLLSYTADLTLPVPDQRTQYHISADTAESC